MVLSLSLSLAIFVLLAILNLNGQIEGRQLAREEGNWVVAGPDMEQQTGSRTGPDSKQQIKPTTFRQSMFPSSASSDRSSALRFSPFRAFPALPPLSSADASSSTSWADKRASLLARLANQSARGFGRK